MSAELLCMNVSKGHVSRAPVHECLQMLLCINSWSAATIGVSLAVTERSGLAVVGRDTALGVEHARQACQRDQRFSMGKAQLGLERLLATLAADPLHAHKLKFA